MHAWLLLKTDTIMSDYWCAFKDHDVTDLYDWFFQGATKNVLSSNLISHSMILYLTTILTCSYWSIGIKSSKFFILQFRIAVVAPNKLYHGPVIFYCSQYWVHRSSKMWYLIDNSCMHGYYWSNYVLLLVCVRIMMWQI